jgi:hypothetical protein
MCLLAFDHVGKLGHAGDHSGIERLLSQTSKSRRWVAARRAGASQAGTCHSLHYAGVVVTVPMYKHAYWVAPRGNAAREHWVVYSEAEPAPAGGATMNEPVAMRSP